MSIPHDSFLFPTITEETLYHRDHFTGIIIAIKVHQMLMNLGIFSRLESFTFQKWDK